MGDRWRRTGFSGLGRAIKNLGLETNSPIDLHYVVSPALLSLIDMPIAELLTMELRLRLWEA
jgi:hypothetical protein